MTRPTPLVRPLHGARLRRRAHGPPRPRSPPTACGARPTSRRTGSPTRARYASQRHSLLRQIDAGNVKNLELKWVLPNQTFGAWQSTPLVVDGVMYVTQRPNDVLAVDAKTGRVFWQYRYTVSPDARVCCGANNRGLAILGSTLFMGTLDGHLVAIDAAGGRPLWNVARRRSGARLLDHDGAARGEGQDPRRRRRRRVRHSRLRRRVRSRHPARSCGASTPFRGLASAGHETWSGDTWKTGGGSVWMTPSYDPALNLTYWGIGNPGPDWNADLRPGDNLFTDSVIALDADTGALKWHFQFTPNDTYDYDSVQVAVLADITWRGTPTKALMWANRNGFFYVLNRETGAFLVGRAVREGELGQRARRARAARSDAAAAGTADVAGQPGRHQLVLAVVQPAHRALLPVGLGRVRVDLPQESRPPTFPDATSPAAGTPW